jgi:flagellin-like hook-associated protein FlgL
MTQDGSSITSDVAAGDGAPPEFQDLTEPQKAQLEDADTLVSDQICEQISDRSKGAMHVRRDDYSATTKDLLRRAWTIAAQLQHYQVEAEHIIVGMVTGHYSSGAPSEFAGLDPATLRNLRLRTMTALARLETAAEMAPAPNLWAAADVVSWICEAMRIAQSRGEPIEPDDLFQVMVDARQPEHLLHNKLRDVFDQLNPGEQIEAARSSRPPSPSGALVPIESSEITQQSVDVDTRESLHRLFAGVREANRAIRSAHQTASRARTEVKRLRTALDTIPAGSNKVEENLAQLRTHLNELRSQITDVDARTADIKDTELASLDKSVAHCRNHLSELGRHTAAIRDRLPRPPAGPWVALAIVGMVLFGLALGIGLSDPSSLGAVVTLARTALAN